jgi:hypothetical protein
VTTKTTQAAENAVAIDALKARYRSVKSNRDLARRRAVEYKFDIQRYKKEALENTGAMKALERVIKHLGGHLDDED